MTGYPSLTEMVVTIGQIAFFFLLGIVGCACIMRGLYWLLKKCDPE